MIIKRKEYRSYQSEHRQIIYDFSDRIKSNGQKFRKKHGEWWRCHIYDEWWVTLDTWNMEIALYNGEPIPGIGNGPGIYNGICWCFHGHCLGALCYDFGDISIDEFWLNYWRLHL